MNPIEVQEKLKEIMDVCNKSSSSWVSLVIVRKSLPAGEKVRLFNTVGPLGEIKDVTEKEGMFEVSALFNKSGVYRCCEDIISELSKNLRVNETK